MPYRIVRELEQRIADYAGSKYAVAVESGSAAIFLSCVYAEVGRAIIPSRTYPSVPCSIIHAGGWVEFCDEPWEGIYQISPWNVWDGALRFRRGMYQGGLHCLSFHSRKRLNIGRGGMILTDSQETAGWLRRMRFDGRDECALSEQKDILMLGWNMYMAPEQAARGLVLFDHIKHMDLPDLPVCDQGYPDLSKFEIYRRYVPTK